METLRTFILTSNLTPFIFIGIVLVLSLVLNKVKIPFVKYFRIKH